MNAVASAITQGQLDFSRSISVLDASLVYEYLGYAISFQNQVLPDSMEQGLEIPLST